MGFGTLENGLARPGAVGECENPGLSASSWSKEIAYLNEKRCMV
jgi:hypothetical protein